MIAAILAVMFYMDWRLTLITLLTVPMLFAATTWFRKGARKGFDLVRIKIARIYSFLQEHFSGAQTVQIFNAEAKSLRRFARINDEHRQANIDTIYYYAVFFPLVDLIGATGIALIIWYGGYRVMQNALTLGGLVASSSTQDFLFQPIRDISDKYNVLQGAVVASHRIFKALDLPILINSPAKPLKSGPRRGPDRIRKRLVRLQRGRLGPERRFLHRIARAICRPRGPHRVRQNNDYQSVDAFL
jgi:ATP-binding cassette subfamily B protein